MTHQSFLFFMNSQNVICWSSFWSVIILAWQKTLQLEIRATFFTVIWLGNIMNISMLFQISTVVKPRFTYQTLIRSFSFMNFSVWYFKELFDPRVFWHIEQVLFIFRWNVDVCFLRLSFLVKDRLFVSMPWSNSMEI